MEKVKVGIIGMGNMGSSHAEWIRDGLVKGMELACVCDIAEARREWCKNNLGDVMVFDDADKMLESGLCNAVIVAVPHYDHEEYVIKALNLNLHVYNEKPAGVYTQQALNMNEVAEKKPELVYSMGFNQRTRPDFQKIRELVKSGELGHIKKVIWIATDWYRAQSYHDSCSWRSTWKGEGGGTIANQNPHNLDLFQWIFGMPSEILSVNDYGKYYNIEVEDDVTAFFKYDDGMIGIYTTSTGEAPGTNRLEISCDMGKIVCEFGKVTFWRNVESEREFNKKFEGIFGTPECWKCEIPVKEMKLDQHVVLLQNFTDAILKGKELLAPGVDGINELTIANAIYYSDWQGSKWVDLKNFDHDGFYAALQEKVKNSTVVKNVVQKTTSTDGSY